ncbi:hypothetical protein LCGC14_1956410 [marine sediment metagenome]|uniref:Class III cytochrome C domain-containing protein n=1 Tax=marine sediment metagenome TaxID=412755 RepID=A0A0F9ID35_9ZZZZ
MKHLLIALSAGLCLLITTAMAFSIEVPGVITFDSLQDKYKAVVFDHSTHTFIAEGCGQCHHEHGSDNSRCSSCHSIESEDFRDSAGHGFLACKNCHGDFDLETPGMPGLKVAYHEQCFQCHRGMGSIGNGPEGCTQLCHAKASQ